MDAEEKRLIDGLFARLRDTDRTAPPPDGEADRAISAAIARLPQAPYYMAQTIIVQDHTLAAAKARIEALEAKLASLEGDGTSSSTPTRGGFLAGLLDRDEPPSSQGSAWGRRSGASVPAAGISTPRPAQSYPGDALSGASMMTAAPLAPGGGFLAGAARTAVGVAGGVMLGSMLGNLFSSHHPFGGALGGFGDGIGGLQPDVTNITENVFVEPPAGGYSASDAGPNLQPAEFQPGNEAYYQEASADLGTDPGDGPADDGSSEGGYDEV